jgi:hypothetical protein
MMETAAGTEIRGDQDALSLRSQTRKGARWLFEKEVKAGSSTFTSAAFAIAK